MLLYDTRRFELIGAIPAASHTLGSQGWLVADLVAGGAGRAEILVSTDPSSAGTPEAGVYALRIPTDPAAAWPPQVRSSSRQAMSGAWTSKPGTLRTLPEATSPSCAPRAIRMTGR